MSDLDFRHAFDTATRLRVGAEEFPGRAVVAKRESVNEANELVQQEGPIRRSVALGGVLALAAVGGLVCSIAFFNSSAWTRNGRNSFREPFRNRPVENAPTIPARDQAAIPTLAKIASRDGSAALESGTTTKESGTQPKRFLPDTPSSPTVASAANNRTTASNDSKSTAPLAAPAVHTMTESGQQLEHQVIVVVEHKVERTTSAANKIVPRTQRTVQSGATMSRLPRQLPSKAGSVSASAPLSTVRSPAFGITGLSGIGTSASGALSTHPVLPSAAGAVGGIGHH